MGKPLRIRIPLNGRQFLAVVIWETHAEYLNGTAHFFQWSHNKHRNRLATYAGFKKTCGRFGSIYFSKENISAATVAHELAHFYADVVNRKYAPPMTRRQDEFLAQLIDRCTNTIWVRFFKRWPRARI